MTQRLHPSALILMVCFALPSLSNAQSVSERTLAIESANLGDNVADLVYAPVTPCRIIDTRSGGGALVSAVPRDFVVAGTDGFPIQGGIGGGCGIPTTATAVLINFVAVNPQGGGNLRGTAFSTPFPAVGSILNYQALTPTLNIANGIIFPICNHSAGSCSFDITLQANGAGTQVVADVLGYFKRFPTEQTITGIDAGTGLTGGGSQGNVSLGISTASSTAGQVLTSTGSGVEWQTPTGGPVGGTSSNTPNTLVLRDGSGSFAAGSVTLSSILNLPASSSTAGKITLAGSPFLHGYGTANTFLGANAGNFTMTGNSNTAIGDTSFVSNAGGIGNTTVGYWSMHYNTGGSSNTALGHFALVNNTLGSGNIAIGKDSGTNATTGSNNIYVGSPGAAESGTIRIGDNSTHTRAFISGIQGVTTALGTAVVVDGQGQLMTNPGLVSNLGGEVTGPLTATVVTNAVPSNTAGAIVRRDSTGNFAGSTVSASILALPDTSSATQGLLRMGTGAFLHNYGSANTFLGAEAGNFTMSGSTNTALGAAALARNTLGNSNTSTGYWSLYYNTAGASNTAAGHFALVNNTTGSNNIAIGESAGYNLTTGSNNIAIGNTSIAGESNIIRIGTQGTQQKTFIAAIRGVNTGTLGIPVLVDANGQLGTNEGNGPTSENVPNTLVLRDGSGNFAAGTITANLLGSSTTFTSALGGEVTGTQSATVVSNAVAANSADTIVRRDGSGSFSAGTINLTGKLTLPVTTPSVGSISLGGSPFAHAWGGNNTFLGPNAGNFTMTGSGQNTAVGYFAFNQNASGHFNTAIGSSALERNTTGFSNTAVGKEALAYNTEADFNTAVGTAALYSNTTGLANTAVGAAALMTTVNGFANTAVGTDALRAHVGNHNTALGAHALLSNTDQIANTAVGSSALRNQTGGSHNTAVGTDAMYDNLDGDHNTAIGFFALGDGTSGDFNTALGSGALQNGAGDYNIALGDGAGFLNNAGDGNIYIGSAGEFGESYVTRIGRPWQEVTQKTFMYGIGFNTGGFGLNYNPSTAEVFWTGSSARYKKDIETLTDRDERLMRLRPVTFRYRKDEAGSLQYGLIAEEVAEIFPELVGYKDGKAESVFYQFLPPMLLHEVQKQRKQIDALQSALDSREMDLRAENSVLRDQIERLLQRVEQLEQRHELASR